MLTSNAVPQCGNYEKYYSTTFFDGEAFAKAENLFDEYRLCGVILNNSFNDREWLFTNQLSNISISFQLNETSYQRNAAPWVGCGYAMFVRSVKTYAVFCLGSISISGIREIVNSLRMFVEFSEEYLMAAALERANHMSGFLSALPGGHTRRDAMIESLEERQWGSRVQPGKNRQRVLAELGTYFKFDDAMQGLWESIKASEKLFWFPLYLWWTLTAILPLRTTEFLLTPRECLTMGNGKTLVTLRRTKLKGGGRGLSYLVDKDYEKVRYIIPDKMAGEIERYQEATNTMTPTPLSTLFVQEPHYAYLGKKLHGDLGYYTYTNLSTCLRRFQEDVMGVSDESRIHLGDTRHLAMIGLILSGGSPLICKELAGHDDINISSHYYSNISSYIKSATYEAHLKYRAPMADLAEQSVQLPKTLKQSVPVQGGLCGSGAYVHGGIDDCIKSIGLGGEIGDCRRCPHFIDGDSGVHLLFSNPVERKQQVDKDSQYLLQTLEAVRRGIGMPEDIQSALLRLQQSGSWYRRCLQNEWGGRRLW